MHLYGTELNVIRLREARKRFSATAKQREKVTLTFDALLRLFADDMLSFRDIARVVGVSKVRVIQLYRGYFEGVFAEQISRYERSRRARKSWKARLLTDFSGEEVLDEVARMAVNAGCTVEYILRKGRNVQRYASMVRINDKKYRVHLLTHKHIRHQSDTRLSRSELQKNEGAIIVLRIPENPDRIFIVPSKILLEAYGHQRGRTITVYPPFKRASKRRRPSKLNWWEYENAWPCRSK